MSQNVPPFPRRATGEVVSEMGSGAREAAVLLSSVIVHAWAVRQRRAA